MPSRERPGIGPSGWREAPWFIVSLVFQLWAAPCILGLAVVTSDEMPILHAYILALRTPYCRKIVRVWRWIQFRIFGFLPCSQQTTNPTEVNAIPSSRDPKQLQASLTWRPECVVPGTTLVGRRQPTRTKHSRPVAQLPWISPGRPRWNRDTRALFNALLRTIGRVASQKSKRSR